MTSKQQEVQARLCPYCEEEIAPDAPEVTECPRCHNILRPTNPYQSRFILAILITVALYFIAFGFTMFSENPYQIAIPFLFAFISGIWLIFVMAKFFKAGA
jgi:uncharacterized paraquat-inducible protein A